MNKHKNVFVTQVVYLLSKTI